MKNKESIYRESAKRLSSLKHSSKDNANDEYLTEDTRQVINFDLVTKHFVKELKLGEIKSNDALFYDVNLSRWIFVEFKNGSIGSQEEFKIRKKNYDSVLIFSEIAAATLSEIRENMDYILVYNDEKNSSRNSIGAAVSKYAQVPTILYGLQIFQNYCFHRVQTLTKDEFANYISNTQLYSIEA